MAQRILTLILLLCSSTAFASGLFGSSTTKPQFLPTDQAFNFTYQQQDHQLVLKWQISPDYYLYRQEIAITAENASITSQALPDGLPHKDEFFGDTAIYRQQLLLPVTINSTQPGATVTVTYQGCAEAGFCYPPQIRQITLHPVTPMPDTVSLQTNQVTDTTSDNTTVNTQSVAGNITADTTTSNTGQLPFNPLWALLIGIGIAFTPCVLPMYPLISGIVLGGKQRLSTGRTLWLSLVYVQGMAVTYTVLGVVVALAGLKFQAAFQSPWVLIGLSIVFILLALSMFGLFTLQLPSSIQTRLTLISNHQQGGATWGVFSMGAIAGLICSPCTTAPLSAILLYIAQSGNLWQGAGTLYLYALGMGLPLIAVTLFGNRLLPKSGPWMQNVKIGFGFVILALPVFLLERIVDTSVGLLMWAALGTAFFAWLFIISLQSKRRWMWPVQICCLLAALAVLPVQQLLFSPAVSDGEAPHLGFTQIHNSAEFEQALLSAKGKPVMLDLYADWCVACKEFEKYTFTDPRVQKALDNVILLQINMTRTTQETAALSDQLEVIGLPTILFFNPQGEELTEQRVIGFMDADHFLAHINSK